MKKDKQEKILFLLISVVYLLTSILVLFFSNSIYSLHEFNLYQRNSFSDIVFDRNNNGNSYAYYDSFNDLRAKHNNSVINADIYIAPEDQEETQNWFSLNWTLNELSDLKTHEMVISKNIATSYGIDINDVITMGSYTFKVVDFLPTMKGFQIVSNREGVMLTSFQNDLYNTAETYMYFNRDPQANFSNSQVIRSNAYLSIYQNPNLFFLGIYFFLAFMYPVILHLSSFINYRKILIWKNERFRVHSIIKKIFISTSMIPITFGLLNLLITNILAYPNFHFTIINTLIINFLILCISTVLFLLSYVLIIFKRGKHNG